MVGLKSKSKGVERGMNKRMDEWEGALVKSALMLRNRDVEKERLTELDSSGRSGDA